MVENNNKQIENIQYDLFDKHIKGSITNDYMCYAVYTSIGDLGKKYYFKSTWTFDKVLASLSSEIENEYYDSKERIIQKNINGDKYYFLLLPYIFPLEKYSDSGGRKVTFFQIIVTKKNIKQDLSIIKQRINDVIGTIYMNNSIVDSYTVFVKTIHEDLLTNNKNDKYIKQTIFLMNQLFADNFEEIIDQFKVCDWEEESSMDKKKYDEFIKKYEEFIIEIFKKQMSDYQKKAKSEINSEVKKINKIHLLLESKITDNQDSINKIRQSLNQFQSGVKISDKSEKLSDINNKVITIDEDFQESNKIDKFSYNTQYSENELNKEVRNLKEMLNRYMDSLENIEERLKQIEKKVIEDLGELAIEVLILRETKKGIWFEDIRRQELMQKHNEKFK